VLWQVSVLCKTVISRVDSKPVCICPVLIKPELDTSPWISSSWGLHSLLVSFPNKHAYVFFLLLYSWKAFAMNSYFISPPASTIKLPSALTPAQHQCWASPCCAPEPGPAGFKAQDDATRYPVRARLFLPSDTASVPFQGGLRSWEVCLNFQGYLQSCWAESMHRLPEQCHVTTFKPLSANWLLSYIEGSLWRVQLLILSLEQSCFEDPSPP